MGVLLLTGETSQIQEWDINDIIGLNKTRERLSLELQEYDLNNKIGPYCNGFTYLEIEEINNQFNNFK